jgi:hypothetical protein
MIDDIPDTALAVVEHATLFYLIDQRVQNKMMKYLYFAVAGAGYEMLIDRVKKQDAGGLLSNGKQSTY